MIYSKRERKPIGVRAARAEEKFSMPNSPEMATIAEGLTSSDHANMPVKELIRSR